MVYIQFSSRITESSSDVVSVSNRMLRPLLISREHGRRPETYGVKKLEKYNMKFTFICVVIVVSCGVSVNGESEFYSGLKYNNDFRRDEMDDEQFIARAEQKLPWQKSPYEDDFEFPNIKDIIDWKAKERNREIDNQMRYAPARQAYREKIKEEFGMPVKNTPARQYIRYTPEDFSFKEDEDEELKPARSKLITNTGTLDMKIREANKKKYLEQVEKALNTVLLERKKEKERLAKEKQQHEHEEDTEDENDSETDDFMNKMESNAKVLEEGDPSEFGYGPSDSRFFNDKTPDAWDRVLNQNQLDTERLDEKQNVIERNFLKVKSRGETAKDTPNDQMQNDKIRMENINRKAGQEEDVIISKSEESSTRMYLIAIIAGISAAATVGLIAVVIGWFNLQKHVKNASDVEYPAYGVTGPNKDVSPSSGDRRLAQSAQMYHYQHQKQQILAMENRAPAVDRHGSVSEADSDEENEEGDYTVYECPGLAPTGEMEVKNPMFQDDPTPAQTPQVKINEKK